MSRTILKLARPINEIEIDLDENTLEAEGYIKVVRCNDCKYYWKNMKDNVDEPAPACLASPKIDAFCSEGERKDDADNR